MSRAGVYESVIHRGQKPFDEWGFKNEKFDGYIVDVVSDSGLVLNSNSGRTQELIFVVTHKRDIEHHGYTWKISVRSENYADQSHAYLYLLNKQNEWTLISSLNPKRNFNIDVSYKNNLQGDEFVPIYKAFTETIMGMHRTLS